MHTITQLIAYMSCLLSKCKHQVMIHSQQQSRPGISSHTYLASFFVYIDSVLSIRHAFVVVMSETAVCLLSIKCLQCMPRPAMFFFP